MDDVGDPTVTIDTRAAMGHDADRVGHAYLAQRMRAVRGFARYLHGIDPADRRSRRLSYCRRAGTARPRTSTQTTRSPR